MTEPKLPEAEIPALTRPSPGWLGGRKERLVIVAGGLICVGMLLLSWFVWQGADRLEATRQELSRRLADGDAMQREGQTLARQHREALDALQAKLGVLEAQAAEMQSQQLALDAMYQELSRVKDDRLLLEIEQEVSLAAQQLQLAGNVGAALIALQAAEARLAKNPQPQFLSLRKLVARDIERLKALPGADVPGIALKLDGILNKVSSLPLAFEQRPAAVQRGKQDAKDLDARVAETKGAETKEKNAAAGGWTPGTSSPAFAWPGVAQTWLAELWREIRQLIRIERIDRPDPGLLAPREIFFLRENLRLRLLSARLALLARDGRTFQSDLKQAGQWLEHYFSQRDAGVIEAQAMLLELARLDIMREPAELSETLAALRNFKLARERAR